MAEASHNDEPSTTPSEDRDWVPEVVFREFADRQERLPPEFEKVIMENLSQLYDSEPTPDLSGLKAALEGLREAFPDAWKNRRARENAIGIFFCETERAGLLTDERPADPVEVAREALERIASMRNNKSSDLSVRLAATALAMNALDDLAALRQGRGE